MRVLKLLLELSRQVHCVVLRPDTTDAVGSTPSREDLNLAVMRSGKDGADQPGAGAAQPSPATFPATAASARPRPASAASRPPGPLSLLPDPRSRSWRAGNSRQSASATPLTESEFPDFGASLASSSSLWSCWVRCFSRLNAPSFFSSAALSSDDSRAASCALFLPFSSSATRACARPRQQAAQTSKRIIEEDCCARTCNAWFWATWSASALRVASNFFCHSPSESAAPCVPLFAASCSGFATLLSPSPELALLGGVRATGGSSITRGDCVVRGESRVAELGSAATRTNTSGAACAENRPRGRCMRECGAGIGNVTRGTYVASRGREGPAETVFQGGCLPVFVRALRGRREQQKQLTNVPESFNPGVPLFQSVDLCQEVVEVCDQLSERQSGQPQHTDRAQSQDSSTFSTRCSP
eukprot:1556106-Rhodomonas_salina.2